MLVVVVIVVVVVVVFTISTITFITNCRAVHIKCAIKLESGSRRTFTYPDVIWCIATDISRDLLIHDVNMADV